MDFNSNFDPRMMNPDIGFTRFDTSPNSNIYRGVSPIPFYQMCQMPTMYSNAKEEERDMERFKDMFSLVAREVQSCVDDECDKMEYDGSLMFDEYPDKVMVRRISMRIYEKVKHLYDVEEDNSRDELLSMSRRTEPVKRRRNWLGELIDITLFNEMFRRRCRRRNCRRW